MDFDYSRVVSTSDTIGITSRATERFLLYLYEHESDTKLNMQRHLGLPSSIMSNLIEHFPDVVTRDPTSLHISETGREYARQLASYRNGKDEEFGRKLPIIESELQQLEPQMDKSKRRLDQVRATPETVRRRIEFLYERGWLEQRSIMLMGDNDIMSIGLAMTDLPRRVTVFDIDHDLIKFINSVKPSNGLKVECSRYDARKPFSERLSGKYDIAVTDPPYTPEGLDLFIRRCIQGINNSNGAVLISFGYSDRSRERVLPLQDILTKRGLVIEEIAPSFNRYFAAQIIGCQSSLYLCRTTPKTTSDSFGYNNKKGIYTSKRPWKKSRRDHAPRNHPKVNQYV